MKKIIYNIIVFLTVSALLFLKACDLQEVNENPNAVTEVPANVLLPYNEESLARLMIGTTQVMSGIFVQYYEGVENHPLPVQTYRIDEALYTEWNFQDYYNGPMINLKQMIDIAEQDGNIPHYAGIGKTLLALALGNVTSLWGDVPYTEALQGSLNLYPTYDDQKSIYENIQLLLDEAIVDFESENPGMEPETDDLFYAGNIEKWKQTVYALKARYYLHLSKRTSDLDYNPAQEALSAVENAYQSSSDDLVYQYGYSAAEQSPFYSYTRLGYIKPNTQFTMLLFGKNDPRDTLFYSIKYGEANLEDRFYTSPESPVHMMTYYEQKFIEAEARLRINESDPEIQNALNEAVYANMKKMSKGMIHDTIINDYLNNQVVLTGNFDDDLETIMVQKYIAMYATIESWTDYRRTGYPELTPNEGGDHNQNPGGDIPRRLPYCQTERLYNPNTPSPIPNLQDRFWWDAE